MGRTLCVCLWSHAEQFEVRGGAHWWQRKVEGIPRSAPAFLKPSSPGLALALTLHPSPSEPALSAGHRPPRHRAAAPHAHLPHRHLHPLQERQAHQVGGWLFGGQPGAWWGLLARMSKVAGMGCWVGAEDATDLSALKQTAHVGMTLLLQAAVSHSESVHVSLTQPLPPYHPSALFGCCHNVECFQFCL